MEEVHYYVRTSDDGEEIADEYEALFGPNGFRCVITEPEDRTFGRDLSDIVDELNRLARENAALKAKLGEA